MLRMARLCKISYALYALVLAGKLVLSILITITGEASAILVHTGGWQNYVPSFFSGMATVSFYYLITVFVEKWCKKNDIP